MKKSDEKGKFQFHWSWAAFVAGAVIGASVSFGQMAMEAITTTVGGFGGEE